ncbi:MAG TPA: hypothetical protein VE569_04985 [Acidimicrobiia bacterium]|nr:hypothetical protein [Acidimicrobiia bacterium]
MATEMTSGDFAIETSSTGLGYNTPQKMGRRLWAPMWLMAVMAFPVALILGIVQANAVAQGQADTTIAALGHVKTGIMFIGFTGVFTAISFAIAKILGEFRKGGGEVQELVSREVRTLKMPTTAKLFMLLMAMAMMTILIASIIHLVVAAQVSSGSISLGGSETAAINLEAVRRIGVATYLVAIALGLATITRVLRFQAIRVRELAS